MASTKSHSQSSYSILLLQKLLSLRDGISPLTLVLDSVLQPGTVLVEEFMLRAKAAGSRVVYVSSTIAFPRRSPNVDVVVERRRKSLEVLRDEIVAQCQAGRPKTGSPQKTLIVVDSLCQIAQRDPLRIAAFVSSLASPTASVLGLYHTDNDGLASEWTAVSHTRIGLGKPSPYKVLCHLATAIVRVHALHVEVSRKRARDRAQPEPHFGWTEGEGGLFGFSDPHYIPRNVVGLQYADDILVDMELRRRSGRAVVDRYVMAWRQKEQKSLPQQTQAKTNGSQPSGPPRQRAVMPWDAGATPCTDITVMDDHPLFAAPPDPGEASEDGTDDMLPESTFSLGLTEKQRRDREGIVLPYFDAQTDIGAGEGGKILYEMGREDDFDDEEDEI